MAEDDRLWEPTPFRAQSGHFPDGPSASPPTGPPRPTYREPYPVRAAAIAAAGGATVAWLLLFAALGGGSLPGYVWWTLFGGTLAWASALALSRLGDRGAAVGIAVVTALGWSLAVAATAYRWHGTGDWPLW
jgi:hypothetical protein